MGGGKTMSWSHGKPICLKWTEYTNWANYTMCMKSGIRIMMFSASRINFLELDNTKGKQLRRTYWYANSKVKKSNVSQMLMSSSQRHLPGSIFWKWSPAYNMDRSSRSQAISSYLGSRRRVSPWSVSVPRSPAIAECNPRETCDCIRYWTTSILCRIFHTSPSTRRRKLGLL